MVAVADVLLSLLAGGVAGVVAGLFGVGGGIIMVPILHYGLGLPFHLATMVSLGVITVNTPFGLHKQHERRNVRWKRGVFLGLGGAIGVLLGVWVWARVPDATLVPILKSVFALLLLYAAWRMTGHEPTMHDIENDALLIPAGIVAGLAANLLGIGGGLLMVPVLVFTGTVIHHAVATSLVAVFTNAALSTAIGFPVLVHHLLFALPIAIGAIFGIRGGVRLANALKAERLRRVFALGLVLIGIGIVVDAVGILW
ncbi:MAG: sulfite exporter TauE/SafE family protein [Euryarchaeota archaeon]|nr:sulfite exporter TauE/SafE family protein [Euryarchaeota archaeon]